MPFTNLRLGKLQTAVAFVLAAFICAACIVSPQPVQAQGTLKETIGDWQVRCDTPPGATSEQCALIQSVTAEDRQNVGLTVTILKGAEQDKPLMRVLTPLGVLIPSGLGLIVDQKEIGRAPYVRCQPTGCATETFFEQALLDQFRNGQTALFIIFQTPEEGIGIPVSLQGLGQALDRLDQLNQ